MYKIYGERRLLCPAAGRAIPLQELSGGENSRRYSGEGFAVRAAGGVAGLLLGKLPAVEITSPADGAVIALRQDAFTLRTGDGLELSVELCGAAEFFISLGDVMRAGQQVCRMSQEQFREASAAVIVSFPDSSRITELHVHHGIRLSGRVAAEYRILQE